VRCRPLAARLGIATLLAVATTLAATVPASAAGAIYGQWAVSGSGGTFTGTVTLPAAGFPVASFTSDSSEFRADNDVSSFIGAGTPPGKVFGSSQGRTAGHAFVRPATGNLISATVFEFATPTPASGWAFILGDIDADYVEIDAAKADGTAATATELGWQGGFNLCNTTPRPPTCGAPPDTDLPRWDPQRRALIGNGTDTSGSAGWFRPTVPLSVIRFVFGVQSGNPIYNIWFTTLTRSVGGKLTGGCQGKSATGTVRLLHPDGTPVPGAETTTDGAGNYAFPTVAPGRYQIQIEPAPGIVVDGPNPRSVDVTAADATAVDFTLTCSPPPPTTTTTTPPPPPSTITTPPPASEPPTTTAVQPAETAPLASTGGSLGPWIGGGALLLVLGSALLHLTRKRRRG
jgi:hypothetical protein